MASAAAQTTKKPEAVKTLSDIRAIAKSTGFAAKVFRQGANGLTAAQITQQFRQILTLAGVDLPKGALITLDSVQVILAGGALTTAVSLGKSIKQCASPIALTVSAATTLLADCGIMSSEVANVVNLGTNVLLIITSGGANILAWIGAAIAFIAVCGDIGHALLGDKEAAIREAKSVLYRNVMGELEPRRKYAVEQVSLYQAGKLNPFDLIANIANRANYFFKDFFPDLNAYFPSWIEREYTVTVTSQGLFGSENASETFVFPKQLITDDRQISKVLIKKYILEPMKGYENDFLSSDSISLSALTVLVMLTATTTGEIPLIGFDFDVVSTCRALGITPYILGDDFVFEGRWSRNENQPSFDPVSSLPYSPLTLPEAKSFASGPRLVVNGVAQENDDDRYFKKLKNFQYSLYQADRHSDIDTIYRNPEGRAMLERWGKIKINPSWPVKRKMVLGHTNLTPYQPEGQNVIYRDIGTYAKTDFSKKPDYTGENEPLNLVLKSGSSPITDQPWFDLNYALLHGDKDPMYQEYIRNNYLIDLSNYMKCLNVVSVMRKAEIFARTNDTDFLAGLDSLDKINERFDLVHRFTITKTLNLMARKNIADYLGVDPDKLEARMTENGHYVFK